MMNTKRLKYTTLALAIIAILLLLNTFRLKRQVDDQGEIITTQQLENQNIKTTINEQGQTISKQKVIITSSQEALNKLTDTIFDLKKKDAKNTQTLAYFKTRFKIRVDSVEVPYIDIAERQQFADSLEEVCHEVIDAIEATSIQVPAIARISNDTLTMQATIGKESLSIDEIIIPDELNVRFVEHKGKLFKKKTVEVQFFHTNPLFKTEQAQSVMYQPKKKSFLQRVLLPVAGGLVAGILIAK